jgi:arylsulfatase A-like enzyme
VLFPPYTLEGKDSFESLPRILHDLGYRTGQETVRYYADGPDLNFEGAFDYANGRSISTGAPGRFSLAFQHPRMLSKEANQRLSERVLQLAFVERMADPHAQVVSAGDAKAKKITGVKVADADRMRRIETFMTTGPQPFFAHIHLLGTHCCTYHAARNEFSKGEFKTPAQLNQAKLADAILESDAMFGAMMEMLERRGMLENTIVVYTSDHNTRWEVRARVPLIFIFPKGEHRGHVEGNSQLLDVSPTLLDYLGVEVPDWMEGASLLSTKVEHTRPIYSIFRLTKKVRFKTNANERLGRIEAVGPPTYGLSTAGLVVCQRWYIIRLSDH